MRGAPVRVRPVAQKDIRLGVFLSLYLFRIRKIKSTFYARIAGNSMIEAGIHDGDIVVIDRSLEAQNGNYVAACIDGEFTIKEYQFDAKNQCAWLIPHNKDFQKIKVTADNQFCIWGVITHCVHKL